MVLKACDAKGQCVATPPSCPEAQPPAEPPLPPPDARPYHPCFFKPCGAPCTLCRPGDPSCVETAVLKTCDAKARCVAAPVSCPPGR